MDFTPFSDRQAATFQELSTLYRSWTEAVTVVERRYNGEMRWMGSQPEMLVIDKSNGTQVVIGHRSPTTEAAYELYVTGAQAAREKSWGLHERLLQAVEVCRQLKMGRLPPIPSGVLRCLSSTAPVKFRVIGVNALYLYENLLGVRFLTSHLGVNDLDVLLADGGWDRQASRHIMSAIQTIDRSFRLDRGCHATMINAEGYEIDLLSSDKTLRTARATACRGELEPRYLEGLEWLNNCPTVEGIVLDSSGEPLQMVCPDPRYFVAHKIWLGNSADRATTRARQHREQAFTVMRLLWRTPDQWPMGRKFLETLPPSLRPGMMKLVERIQDEETERAVAW